MANRIFAARELLGNTGYSLNSIPSDILRTGDMAVVHDNDEVYFYKFTQNTNKTQDSPNIIIPFDSISYSVYGTWELINTYFNQDGYDTIYDNVKSDIFAKTFTINTVEWSTAIEGFYYYNITHNLNDLHPIISVWNMFTNRLINVNILSIDENTIRVETTELLNLKLKILK